MNTDPRPRCGHSYTRHLTDIVYVCVAAPHPGHPDRHHYREEKDAAAVERRRRSHHPLIVVPGER